MKEHESNGKGALDALLTLSGQNALDLDALLGLLVRKGIITGSELDAVMEEAHLNKGVTAAEWARRCINPEDNEALDAFFE